jgi:BirA family biotin operon repressor/biotin-[acetyl-CoA-carboxylase] ligase
VINPASRSARTPTDLFDAPPLARSALEGWLADGAAASEVRADVVARTGSTNEDLLVQCRQRRPDTVLLLAADEQTAGRGRQRRRWLARPRSALLFSLAVPLESLPAALPAVTLACGVALADILLARGVDIRLKWPNDLMCHGRKLAGILCELAVDAEGQATLVVGVGINGWLTDEDRAEIAQPAAALADIVPARLLAGEREAWIAAIAAVLLQAVRRFAAEGFAPFRARFNELLHARGQIVDIVEDGRATLAGTLVEVDALGRLVLAAAGGMRSISVGDVSVRVPTTDRTAG